ncbi:MAG: hypothetical protein DFNUSKGM_001496 [Candidatus Fervidibacter sacchari]
MSEQQEGNEIVKLNIFALVSSVWVKLWIDKWKANLQADQERKRIEIPGFHMSWSGLQEISLPKKQASALASALEEILRKALHRGSFGFRGQMMDEGRQWCVEVKAHFSSLDKDSPELNLARNLVERELNGTMEVYPGTVRIRFPHHQPSSYRHLSSFWSSLLALWRRRR